MYCKKISRRLEVKNLRWPLIGIRGQNDYAGNQVPASCSYTAHGYISPTILEPGLQEDVLHVRRVRATLKQLRHTALY